MAKYSIKAKVWKHQGPASWHFLTLPKTLSKQIRTKHGKSEEGWGRLKTIAQIGKSKWETAIWYDTRAQSYLLPIKKIIRKSENLENGTFAKVNLKFESEISQLKKYKALNK